MDAEFAPPRTARRGRKPRRSQRKRTGVIRLVMNDFMGDFTVDFMGKRVKMTND